MIPRVSSWLGDSSFSFSFRVTPRLCGKIPAKRTEERKSLDRSSHIRHTSTVFTFFILGQDCWKEGRKESRERRKDIKVSVGKNF